jgi:AcrR family transcriptional regulator
MTAPVSLRERKKIQTRAEIFAAAIKLFRAQGYEETTVEQIVAAANYSKATFFRYFASKEDVLFGDADQRLADLKARLATLHGTARPWQAIREAIIEQVATMFATTDPETRTTCMTLWFSIPAYNRRLAVNMAWEEVVAEFLAAERGLDVSADVHSQVIAAMIVGTVRAAMRAEFSGATRLEDAVRGAFGVLEAGLEDRATTSRDWLVEAPAR